MTITIKTPAAAAPGTASGTAPGTASGTVAGVSAGTGKKAKKAKVSLPEMLPVVQVHGLLEKLAEVVDGDTLPPATLAEILIYMGRQRARLAVLDDIEKTIRTKLLERFRATPADKRETLRIAAGMVTYTAPGIKEAPKDRDAIVEALTHEQLRASYIPDLKALKIMLKPDLYDRLVSRQETADRITVRDTGGDYSEL